MDLRGPLSAQEVDVLVDVAARDLVVTMNGATLLRLGLPPSKWRALHVAAAAILVALAAERAVQDAPRPEPGG